MAELQAAQPSRVGFDPLLGLWRLMTSVRFALALIGLLALASLLGVIVPQIPAQMRGDPAAVAGWLDFQEARYGGFTEPMARLGLFDVFHSLWFVSGLGLLVVSVTVCTVNRFAPIWRNVTRPQERVPDDFFDRGQLTIEVEAPDAEALGAELRRRRYRVSLTPTDSAIYLFADRYPWAQLATFVSHLALILFLAGGLVTILTARDTDILIAEGETRPVFNPADSDHMQIYVEDAVGRFDESGFPLDYRTRLVVYKNGDEVARGVSTVNDPLTYEGFKFHQTAYFPDGAALQVRDAATGRLLYDEVLALTDRTPTPRIVVKDAAQRVLLDEEIVPTDFVAGASGSVVSIPGSGRSFWIGTQLTAGGEAWQLVVFETNSQGATNAAALELGESRGFGDVSLQFAALSDVASARISSVPGAPDNVTAEMPTTAGGQILILTPVSGLAVALAKDEQVEIGGYEYTFLGPREFTGITVRRDPGSTVIWVATGLLLLGLALTFYVPRRRLWARIIGNKAAFRGLGGRSAAIEQEIRQTEKAARERVT